MFSLGLLQPFGDLCFLPVLRNLQRVVVPHLEPGEGLAIDLTGVLARECIWDGHLSLVSRIPVITILFFDGNNTTVSPIRYWMSSWNTLTSPSITRNRVLLELVCGSSELKFFRACCKLVLRHLQTVLLSLRSIVLLDRFVKV